MNQYEIIKLKPEDYQKCNQIWDMSRQEHTQKWFDELVSGNRIIFVYTANGEFIGEGALVFYNNDPDYTIPNRRIYLSRMIVKKEFRNQGIGSILIDYLTEYAKKLGYLEISVGVDCDNDNAVHLYQKKGFNQVLFEGEDELGKYFKLLKKM